jgi:DNA-binding beta-propeller fold protein YncE
MRTRPLVLPCALALGASFLPLSGTAVVAQEVAQPPQQSITDFSPREIPVDKRVVMSQETELLKGVDPSGIPLYRVDPFWPAPLPNNWVLGQVAGADVGPDGRIWFVHRPGSLSDREVGVMQDPPINKCCYPAPPVVAFGADGVLVDGWGGPGEGYDWFESEHGIHVDDEGFVWVGGNGDNDHHILKFTSDGEFVLQIGTPGASQGSNDTANVKSPADMEVDEEANEIYVADGYGNRRVVVFDTETGAYKRHWGAYGNVPDDSVEIPEGPQRGDVQQFGSPVHCVRIAVDGRVYVCDRYNNRYQVFEKDGTFVEEAYYERDTLLSGSISDLVLSSDPEQRFVIMVDGSNHEMRIADRAGAETVARVGRPGRNAGQFHVVHDIAIDDAGNLYTTEVNTGQRIQKFELLEPAN